MKAIKIQNKDGVPIDSVEAWHKLAPPTPGSRKQWCRKNSAHFLTVARRLKG